MHMTLQICFDVTCATTSSRYTEVEGEGAPAPGLSAIEMSP